MGIPEDIELFEKSLNDLIIRYEQYFLGLEKREPAKQLDEVEKLSRKYLSSNIVNTMMTFRYNSLKSRFASYKHYWSRTTRLIEEGKYSRDRFKMQIHQKAMPEKQVIEKNKISSEMEQIYQQFVKARKECNLPVDNITREFVAEVVGKHKHSAMNKYKCEDVELRITIENGSPKLKIRPKS